MLTFSAPIILIAANALVLLSDSLSGILRSLGKSRAAVSGGTTGAMALGIFMVLISAVNARLYIDPGRELSPATLGGFSLQGMFAWHSAETISRSDEDFTAVLKTIKLYDPQTTVVVVGIQKDWRKLAYYLPEYRVLLVGDQGPDAYSVSFQHYSQKLTRTRDVILPEGAGRILFINQPLAVSAPFTRVDEYSGIPVYESSPIPAGGVTYNGFVLTPVTPKEV